MESGVIVLESDGRYPSLIAKLHDRRLKAVEWTTRRLAPIEWDNRVYLVDEDKIIEFCNRVNAGDEPRSGQVGWPFFLREGDWEKSANDKPKLPKEFAEYLIDVPFEATVLKQDKYVLNLDRGFDDGVRIGLKMWARFEGEYKYTSVLEVVSVDPESCVAEVRGGRWPLIGETVFIGPPTPLE